MSFIYSIIVLYLEIAYYLNRIGWALKLTSLQLQCRSSKYGKVFNMKALENILNMLEHLLTELWIYLGL